MTVGLAWVTTVKAHDVYRLNAVSSVDIEIALDPVELPAALNQRSWSRQESVPPKCRFANARPEPVFR